MRPTREGARYLLATGLIGLAAMNSGNNLIYIIFGMLLSVLVLSYAIMRVNLSGLMLKVEAEHPVFAGQKAYFRITVIPSAFEHSAYRQTCMNIARKNLPVIKS